MIRNDRHRRDEPLPALDPELAAGMHRRGREMQAAGPHAGCLFYKDPSTGRYVSALITIEDIERIGEIPEAD